MNDKSDPKDGVGTEAPSPPPLRLSPICPNCGRANAVVFPIILLGESKRLVCLKCYPDVPATRETTSAGTVERGHKTLLLNLAIRKAEEAMQGLCVHLHYASSEGGIGQSPDRTNRGQ